MKTIAYAIAALAAACVLTTPVAAYSELSKELLVSPEAGSWLICVTYYKGERAEELAKKLIDEIRIKHRLAAYAINKGGEEKKKQRDEIARKKAEFFSQFPDANVPVRVRMIRIEEEYAVVIGGYGSIDAAQKALKEVRKLPPPDDKDLHPVLTRARSNDDPQGPQGVIEKALLNPYAIAFVVHNPTVPQEKKVENDYPFLKKLNSSEKHSLLKNRKPWTLVVANYPGLQTVTVKEDSSGFWDKLWNSQGGEVLEACGHNAHNLAETLRAQKVEAYVLHMRWGSVVTVGGFESPSDPKLAEMKARIPGWGVSRSGVLLSQPLPMEVPKP